MSLSAEESNFLRFYFLNLKIASKAVRVYFDSIHPPSGLASKLGSSAVTLKGLRFITKPQQKILYPSPACNVRSEDFDTTLIVCLLRNMTPRQCAPATGFDNLPLQGDASTGADLARVKWYRNMLAHHWDGKLSQTYFNQYWTDLESAILRLGGSSLHQESQSALHIVLDTSLTDMLKALRAYRKDIHNLQMLQGKNTNDLQTTLDKQSSVTEKHETEIQQLQDSLQKGETEAKNLATKLSDTTGLFVQSKKEIDACKKAIKTNEEQMVNKQNQVDKLNAQLDKLFKEHCEHLAKHDGQLAKHEEQIEKHEVQFAKHDGEIVNQSEQMAKHGKDIDDLKKKQHNTNDLSSESKRERLEDDTKALIDEDLKEGTFVTTTAVKTGLLLLKQNGVVLITGHAGTGKSRISRHIIHMFCSEYTSYKCIKLNKLQQWEDMVTRKDNVVVLLDDIFGETNCIYNREKDIPILDKIHAYVCRGNIKCMITIRDTVKNQCQEMFKSHRLFKFEFIDLSSADYKLSQEEKLSILIIYMETVRRSNHVYFKGCVDHNGITILERHEITKIIHENPVKGFPLAVYQFVHNDNYFQLRHKFFDRPTETILEEINEIRHKGDDQRKFMVQYGVMVYTAINESGINPDDNSNIKEVAEIIDAIYGETIRMKRYQIEGAIKELKGSYLVQNPNQKFYRYYHPTLQESVILSFAKIDDETIDKIIPLLSWTFFVKMVKSNTYKEKEGEIVLRIPNNSNCYKLLADRLSKIYISEFWLADFWEHHFIPKLTGSEIFQQEDCDLLNYLLDAVEKTDHEDNYTEKMSYNICLSNRKNKDVFLATILVNVATEEKLHEMFQFILLRIKQTIKTDNNYFTIDFLKTGLITSLYQISLTKDGSVSRFKVLLDVVEANDIPVILDQNLERTERESPHVRLFMSEFCDTYTTLVFLSHCILNAYGKNNIPLLEYLLSRYNETPFDVNIFMKVFYSGDQDIELSSLSDKSLKWMLKKFEDQESIDLDFILKTACKLQMLDTLKYLAPKCKKFNAISCLNRLMYDDDLQKCNKGMLNFLFSTIDHLSPDLYSIVLLLLQKVNVYDYIFDAFLPYCLDNEEILNLACKKAHVYVAKQIMEKSRNVDIQSALAACTTAPIYRKSDENHVKIVKYIIEKFQVEQFDLKAVCQQAVHSKNIKIIEWCVKNIDLTLLNIDFIRNSALEEGWLDILEYTFNKTKLSSFEKMKVLKSLTKHYTSECSTKILELVSTVWNSTEDKDGLQMEEIVIAAYKTNCFNLLVWIYENCSAYVSTDVRKLLMLACENGNVEVAKSVFQTFDSIPQVIDGGLLFRSACDRMLNLNFPEDNVNEGISMINWVYRHFQIKPSDLKSELLRLISLNKNVFLEIRMNNGDIDEFPDLVISIFEKCMHYLSTQDLEVVMSKSLDQKNYDLVNWILENDSLCSFHKQHILDKACANAAFKTIELVSKYFSSLDMNHAMINACTSSRANVSMNATSDSIVDCLELLWTKSHYTPIDMHIIVSTVCRQEYIRDKIMTWILQKFPHNLIPINEVLIACCKHRKVNHVKYIFYKVDHKHLPINHVNEAFWIACQRTSRKFKSKENMLLLDFLFQKLHDKTLISSLMLTDLFLDNRHDVILYLLKKGYIMSIDMKHLMNQACRNGHVGLVLWILENVQQTKLNIRYAFHEACRFVIMDNKVGYDGNHLHCVALIWHYIQDINILDIDTVLKTIAEASSNMTSTSDLMNWIKYIQNINQRRICKSEPSELITKIKET